MYSMGSDNMALGYALGRDSDGNRNDGFFGGDGWWGILILLALFWGGGFGGFGGGWGGNSATTSIDASLQRGFDTQSIISKLDGITNGLCDGFYAVNTSLLNGFHGVDNAICQSAFQTQQGFNATQVAMMQGQNALQSQIASCCCGVERSIDGINYNMATNTCAIQTQLANSTRDIIDSQREGTRAVIDWLCAKETADLRAENQNLKLAASQEKQNNYLVNTLRPTAQPAYITCNPFTGTYGYAGYGSAYNGYGYNNGCGCGCGCNG